MEGPSALCTQRDDAASKTLYESDEFRIYCFKILPCSRRYAHDWSACQFAHPNEKAKRRNLRTHKYDCEMCPAVAKGEECPKGPSCPHSHNVFESWLHPQKYRTLLCKDKERCNRAVCFFAHGSEQLRIPCDPIPYMHAPADNQLPAALAGLLHAHSTASSSYSTALSHHGSSSSLVLPAGSPLGTAVSNISSTGFMLGAGVTPGPSAAASSDSLMVTENVEQLLSRLMEEVQLARKEAEQSREAALEAGEKLRMVTAAVAGTGGQHTAGGFSRNQFKAQPFVAPAASSYITDTTMPSISSLFGGQMMATGLAQTPGCSSAVTTMSTNLGWTTGMEQAGSSPQTYPTYPTTYPQTYPTSTFDAVSLGPAATMSDSPGMYGSPGDSMSSITGSINSMLGGFIGASSPAVPAALLCGQLPVNSGTSQRLGGLPLAHQQSVLLPGFAGAVCFAGGNGVRQSAAQATYF